jgi:hypothetical protein
MNLVQYLLAILNRLSQVLTLLGVIQGSTTKAAQENVAFSIDTSTSIIRSVVDWSDVSPGPLKTALIAIEADMATMSATLLAAIADVQQAVDPVVLPTTPPTGYGGGGGGSTAADIWAYPDPSSGSAAIDMLHDAGWLSRNMGIAQVALPSAVNGHWWIGGTWWSQNSPDNPNTNLPELDYSTIASTDATAVDWLNRVYSSWGTFSSFNGFAVIQFPDTDFYAMLNLTQPQFILLRDGSTTTVAGLPPVWPGVADTVISDSQPLSTGLTITRPMDGCIIVLDSVPDKASWFQFDDVKSYRNLGALSFFNDDSDQEFPQPLGFSDMLYTPKQMVRAAGVKVRTVGGVEGRIWTWTIFGT